MTLDENLRELATCGDYWDQLGCPSKPDNGNGDLIHRCGLQAIELYLATGDDPKNPKIATGRNARLRSSARLMFVEQLKAHYLGNGNFKRGHSPVYLHNDPNQLLEWPTWDRVFSRDQSITILIACGLFGLKNWIEQIEKGLASRSGFYTNRITNGDPDSDKTPDLATPPIYALIDRALGRHKQTGRIELGDHVELADSRLLESTLCKPKVWIPWPVSKWTYPFGQNKHHGDPVNKTLVLLYAKMTFETRQGQLARQVYASKIPIWNSWLKYWDRGTAVKENGVWKVTGGDPQCPFHLFFKPYIDALGSDQLC